MKDITTKITAPILLACISLTGCTSTKPVTQIHNQPSEGNRLLIDGFEEENFWYTSKSREDNSLSTEIADEWSTEKDNCGMWTFSRIPDGKQASFSCSSLSFSNWSNAKCLTCDINNMTKGSLEICLEIESGVANEKTRTGYVTLGRGENTNVYFDLQMFKPCDSEKIKKITFIIRGENSGGRIYMDNICLFR